MTDEQPNVGGAPFRWGLTPGGAPEPDPEPIEPDPEPIDAQPPTEAFDHRAAQAWQPPASDAVDVPTAAFAYPGHAAPLDPAIDGVTEALNAHAVGLPDPVDEGLEASDIDSLFGDDAFREYAAGMVPPIPPRSTGGELVRVVRDLKPERAPISTTQKALMWVAGGLVASLALVALFVLGTRLSDQLGPAPAVIVSASPTPSATPGVFALGPVAPGDYRWDQLLGAECLDPYESPWQDSFTVVDCGVPHPAQLLYRGVLGDTPDSGYPGVEVLQARIAPLCTVPTIIDYAATSGATDIQIAASFPATEEDWAAGNRGFFCFANRTTGAPFGSSIAVPQTGPPVPAPAPAATPTP